MPPPAMEEQDGVLEADASEQAEAAQAAAAARRRLGRGDSLGESQRMERLLELDAQHLDAAAEGPLAGPLRAMREAEELGQEAERGLELELARERASASPAPGVRGTQLEADPYERQLETELEDHLCELRIEERRAAAAAAEPTKKLEPAPPRAFAPPERLTGEGLDSGGDGA